MRDLDVVVQGNALKLKKDIEKAHGVLTGEWEAGQALYVRFPGGVRMEIGSTLTVTYPKPGKRAVKPANILDDLRRRDFTANAMALSLNDGSYGLLMDPLNGVADIENRELRLVSNYGFIDDPVRMVRAARLIAYSQDYADHSYYLKDFKDKVTPIYPPIHMPAPNMEHAKALRAEWSKDGGPIIGYSGRFVQEKRPDLLIKSLEVINKTYPNARIVFCGEYEIAYEDTWERHQDLVTKYRDQLIFLGLLRFSSP